MGNQSFLNLGEALAHDLISGQDFTQSDKRFDQGHADGARPWTIQDIGRHQHAMLGKNIWQEAATPMGT